MQPSSSPQRKTGASERGGVLGIGGVIDVAAASLALRRHTIRMPLPSLVQNATTPHQLGALGIVGTIVAAYITYRVVPLVAGGTATYRLAKRTAGNVQTFFSASADTLALTTPGGNAVVLSSYPDLAATDVLEFVSVVSNNAPTQGADGFITFVVDPTEASPISQ